MQCSCSVQLHVGCIDCAVYTATTLHRLKCTCSVPPAVYMQCTKVFIMCSVHSSMQCTLHSAVYTAVCSVSDQKLLSHRSVEAVYPAPCSVWYTAWAVYTPATLLELQWTCSVHCTTLQVHSTSVWVVSLHSLTLEPHPKNLMLFASWHPFGPQSHH